MKGLSNPQEAMEASNHLDHSIGSRLREATSHLFSALVGLLTLRCLGWSPGRRHNQAVVLPGKRELQWELRAAPLNASSLTRYPVMLLGQEFYQTEVGSAGCLTAGTARGEKMRADSEGSLSMRKQMCSGSLDTFQFGMFGQTFCPRLEETFLL